MPEEQRKSGGEAAEDITGKAAKLGRREVLTAIGVVGTALATGTAVSLLGGKSYAETVSQSVYGNDVCCDEPVHMTDYGADGTEAADTAALAALAAYVNAYPNPVQPFGVVAGIPVRVGISRVSAPTKFTIGSGVNFKRPVELVGSLSKVLEYTGTGIMLLMGPDDGRGGPVRFNDDHYIIEGLHFSGGKQMSAGISFPHLTGLLARIKDCVFNSFGNPSSWAIEFQSRNWWPEITGCRWESIDELSKNFVKIIDDGRNGQYRGAGNSRLSFVDNKCKWHGVVIGGIGVYANAVKTLISRSDFENPGVGVQLGYPSRQAEINSCYFELPLGGTAIRLGDETSQGSNVISQVCISDIYANLHKIGKFIDVASGSVRTTGMQLDNVVLTNTAAQTPVLHLNDLPNQWLRVGNVSASYQPIVPVTDNPIKVIDIHGVLNRSVLNGSLIVSQLGDHFTIPANTLTPLADMWFAKTDFPTSLASREQLSQALAKRTRHSTHALRFTPVGSGTYKSVYFMVPNLSEMAGHVCTVQLFARASAAANLRIIAKAAFTPATIVSAELKQEIVALDTEYREFTIPFGLPYHASLSKDSWLIVELSMPDTPEWYEFTGIRINRGEFGLCHSNDYRTEGETLAAVRYYYERRDIVWSGSGMTELTVDMAPKAKQLASAVMTTSSQTIAGAEHRGGVTFNLGSPVTALDAVVDLDTRAFYF
ncbi:MAG: hypothetical protein K0R28_2940 [Paenibacillus sp.]|jgi:hypothetical protein|nr:hypothetical protein [Paenibacillus sp.]